MPFTSPPAGARMSFHATPTITGDVVSASRISPARMRPALTSVAKRAEEKLDGGRDDGEAGAAGTGGEELRVCEDGGELAEADKLPERLAERALAQHQRNQEQRRIDGGDEDRCGDRRDPCRPAVAVGMSVLQFQA